MTVNPQAREARWFAICVACLTLLVIPAFILWAPWTAAIPATQAAARYPDQIDPNG